MQHERRVQPRIHTTFPVECDKLPQRKFFYTVCKDVSLSGAKIISFEFLPKDHSLKLIINLIEKIVQVKAKVVWCNKDRNSERYTAGLVFIELNEDGKQTLTKFVDNVTKT